MNEIDPEHFRRVMGRFATGGDGDYRDRGR